MIDYEGQEYQADMQATIIKLNGNYIVIRNACMHDIARYN